MKAGWFRIDQSTQRVVPVTAGPHDFYPLGHNGDGSPQVDLWAHPRLILLFVPTLYDGQASRTLNRQSDSRGSVTHRGNR